MNVMNCYITSDLAIGENKQPVNLNVMSTFMKFDHPSTKEKDGRHQIEFRREGGNVGPSSVYWKYKSETDRNCDFERLISNYTKTLK